MKRDGIDIEEMTNILNKKSGLLGISGISSDISLGRHLSSSAAGCRFSLHQAMVSSKVSIRKAARSSASV